MADEWWSTSQRNHGSSVTACLAASLVDIAVDGCGWKSAAATVAESTSSLTFQDPHRSGHATDHRQPLSDAASSLGDPHLDWTHAFFSGRSGDSFQSVLQLQEDMAASKRGPLFRVQTPTDDGIVLDSPFRADMSNGLSLLDQAPAPSSSPYDVETTPLQQGVFDGVPVPVPVSPNVSMFDGCQSSASYDGSASTMQFLTQMQDGGAQLQQYLSASSSCYLPFNVPLSTSQLLLQAPQPKTSGSSNSNTLTVKSAQHACSTAPRKSLPEAPAAAKRPRIEAPSSLPTFKVRKEKLGDRITALQQLVSPFGKTDTASVLHEANEYIKFLHDQVASLTSPYLKNVMNPLQQFQQRGSESAMECGDVVPKKDLRSRGLCLVPVATTYTVASETVPEFWHPTFGGTFR